MENSWTFYDGVNTQVFSTFPYAYRTMFLLVKQNLENGKQIDVVTKNFKIIAPTKKVYTFDQANTLATNQGLLSKDGTLNSKEFKRK